MSKKLTGNGLWESSRMILPEHVKAYKEYRKASFKKTNPDLDEQKLDEISAVIRASFHHQASIKITVFDEVEAQRLIGVVTHLDASFKHLTLKKEHQYIKIDCTLITDASY